MVSNMAFSAKGTALRISIFCSCLYDDDIHMACKTKMANIPIKDINMAIFMRLFMGDVPNLPPKVVKLRPIGNFITYKLLNLHFKPVILNCVKQKYSSKMKKYIFIIGSVVVLAVSGCLLTQNGVSIEEIASINVEALSQNEFPSFVCIVVGGMCTSETGSLIFGMAYKD